MDATYGKTKDGLLAARLGDTAFAAIPRKAGGYRIAHAWRPDRQLNEMREDDFYGAVENAPDEAGFRRYVEDQAEHRRQADGLGRVSIRAGFPTPWDAAQTATQYGPGVVSVTTAGHGGFRLDPEQNALIPARWRANDGWYEEDCDWAKVAASFPDLFTDFEKRCADRTLRQYAGNTYDEGVRALGERGVPWAEMAAQDFRQPSVAEVATTGKAKLPDGTVSDWDERLRTVGATEIQPNAKNAISPDEPRRESLPAQATDYWREGTRLIEEKLARAARADFADAPFGSSPHEAALWHKAQAEAFRHALEMMGIPQDLRRLEAPDPNNERLFRVKWEIDVEAADAVEAAEQAETIMQAIDHAPAFDITDYQGDESRVDLQPQSDADARRILEERREARLAEIEELDAAPQAALANPSP